MDRRTFLQTGIGATIGASFVGNASQALAQAADEEPEQAATPTQAQPTIAVRKLTLDAYSRHLQWLRTPDEVADAVFETGCDGVMLTVQPYPGHIDPERVSQDLPPFVNTLRRRGLRVTQIQGPDLTDASAPQVEAIVRAGSGLGITHYWFGTFNYDLEKTIAPQLDRVKLSVDKFVKVNQKHHATVMFHTYSMPTAVGSTVWDLLSVMKNFDPKYVGLHWDTGEMALHGGDMWDALMRVAGPYVAGMTWADRSWHQDIGLKGEGGPYPGPEAIGAGQGGRGLGAGRGRGAPGGGRGPGGRGGRGPGGLTTERSVPLPLGGLIARGGGWSSPIVPFGTGIIEVPKVAVTLRDIEFNGPSLLKADYENGGAGKGLDKITLPRQWVLGAMKRDVLTLRSAFMLAPEAGLSI